MTSNRGMARGDMKLYSLALVALLSLLVGCKPAQNINFGPKAFFDNAKKDADYGIVYIAGTLTGDDIYYKNNSVVVACYKDRMECLTYSIEQIGPNHIGRLDAPTFYPVTKWDDYEVVATESADVLGCSKVTISIVRKSQTGLWVTEPVNQSQAQCKNANTKILKWTIEDSPEWGK